MKRVQGAVDIVKLISVVLPVMVMKPSILDFYQAYKQYRGLGQDSATIPEKFLSISMIASKK